MFEQTGAFDERAAGGKPVERTKKKARVGLERTNQRDRQYKQTPSHSHELEHDDDNGGDVGRSLASGSARNGGGRSLLVPARGVMPHQHPDSHRDDEGFHSDDARPPRTRPLANPARQQRHHGQGYSPSLGQGQGQQAYDAKPRSKLPTKLSSSGRRRGSSGPGPKPLPMTKSRSR